MTTLRIRSLRIGGLTIQLDGEIELDGAPVAAANLSVAEYARLKGVSERSVRRAIAEGRIRCEPFGRRRLIPRDEAVRQLKVAR